MTASTQTLAEWLSERIAEDEAAARKAVSSPWLLDDGGCCVFAPEGRGENVAEMAWDSADHIARWQPARVLAECEAKRRIVELHRSDRVLSTDYCVQCGDDMQVEWPCPTLRLLALPYADHPTYDESWRP